MELAVVVGQCTATVKEASLSGRRFALVQAASPTGEASGPVEVALDVTGAGAGQLVLLARGSAARQPSENRQLAADLSIVAIVDEVTVTPVRSSQSPHSSPGSPDRPEPRRATPTKKTSTSTAPRTRTRTGGK